MWKSLRSKVSGLIGYGNPKATNTRLLQYELDLIKLRGFLSKNNDLDDLVNQTIEQHQSVIAKCVEDQIRVIFNAIDKASSEVRAQSPHQMMNSNTSAVELQIDNLEQQLASKVGFFPSVRKSRINHPQAGEGVFARGNISAGTVVVLYPGKVYMPFQVKRIVDTYHQGGMDRNAVPLFGQLFGFENQRNEHTFQRFDGTILDASSGSTSTSPNYYAVAHKCNHPPKGEFANVMTCPFQYTQAFIDEEPFHKDCVPNAIGKDDGLTPAWWWALEDKDVFCPSVAFVSTRDIQDGEEILVNYRFNPALDESKLPDWYEHKDLEENSMRWA